MKTNRIIQATCRLLLLVGVFALLVAHGGAPTGCQWDSSCPPSYSLAGNEKFGLILASGKLTVSVDGRLPQVLMSPNGIPFSEVSLGSEDFSIIHIVIDTPGPDFTVGDLWLIKSQPEGFLAQGVDRGFLKLINSTTNGFNGGRLEKTFIVTSGFNEVQGSTGPSGAGFMLSGGPGQDEMLLVGGKADFFINGVLIKSSRTVGDTAMPAFALTPTRGDTLRIRIDKDPRLNQTGELWLHYPSGLGSKLSHLTAYDQTAYAFDQEYIIQ